MKSDYFIGRMAYGVMTTPALVVNGEVKAAGKIPSEDQIKNWIK
jgi:protein-disulfide isomerase